jgi:hypothetical protein
MARAVGKRGLKGIGKGDDVVVHGTLVRALLAERGGGAKPDRGRGDRHQEAGDGRHRMNTA